MDPGTKASPRTLVLMHLRSGRVCQHSGKVSTVGATPGQVVRALTPSSVRDVADQQCDMQRQDGLRVVETHAQHLLDPAQLLVVRGPGQMGGGRSGRLVPAVGTKVPEELHQPAAMTRVAGDQRPQLTIGERTQAFVISKQLQQAAQADVVQPV